MVAPFNGLEFAKTLPSTPGVYRMYGQDDSLLYVGKAKHLRRRVSSYFQKTGLDPRIAIMLSHVSRMEISVTRTEMEALILESRLIKSERPKYNIQLRDDRGYPYIHLSTDKAVPRLSIHRGKRTGNGEFFGPFPSREAVRIGYDQILKTFKLRSCDDVFFANRTRPCLQYQIGRCSAPCVGKISPEDYASAVSHSISFLNGGGNELITALAARMDEASAKLDFEAAATLRDQMASLRLLQTRVDVEGASGSWDTLSCAIEGDVACICVVFVRAGQVLGTRSFFPDLPLGATPALLMEQFIGQFYLDRGAPPEILLDEDIPSQETMAEALSELAGRRILLRSNVRGDRARQVLMARKNALSGLAAKRQGEEVAHTRRMALAEMMGRDMPFARIECFDISHTQGEATVASCVVFDRAGPLKNAYRRFNIKGITPGDDYAAMHQALLRRFSGPEPLPDLLLIDGGAGQIEQAKAVLSGLALSIPIVGVSKGPDRRPGEEALLLVDRGITLRPGRASPALQLIQQVRDEAHRFAIQGHRSQRDARRVKSSLEGIAGVGASRRQSLLRSFGGIQGVKAAGVEELARVKGISPALAEKIYAALRAK